MKQIKVSEKCSGCGLCVVNSSYLQEDADGNAVPVIGKAIKESDMENIKKVVNECPESALSIIESGITNKSGKVGAKDVIEDLKEKCNKFSVQEVSSSDIRLNAADYYIPIPSSNKEYRRDYASESAAKSAAKDEFNRLCYSKSAYRPMIKKVFVEYKINVLKPYYNCDDVKESAYFKYNEMVRKYLADAYAEISGLLGDIEIPESWKQFSVYLKEKDWSIQALKEFDERSISSGIITDFKDRGEYTSLSWYVDRLDFDYDEEYVGEGLFGKSKFKNKWYFSGFYEEAKEFVDDLKGSIDSVSGDIEDGAVNSINAAFKTFEEEVKKQFMIKIQELESYIK